MSYSPVLSISTSKGEVSTVRKLFVALSVIKGYRKLTAYLPCAVTATQVLSD
jgi:hypothetical protein